MISPTFTIQSENFKATFFSKGAELCSFCSIDDAIEYIWQGVADKNSWNKHSPILFPIVGALKDGTYQFNGKSYGLPRHGFARDCEFSITDHDASSITFSLVYDEESLQKYPFLFQLNITYAINKDGLNVAYEVRNLGSDTMFFSIGGHPAFNLPITKGLSVMDYDLDIQFVPLQQYDKVSELFLNKDGLIKDAPKELASNFYSIVMNEYLFLNDAIIFANIQSASIRVDTPVDERSLLFQFEGFPYLGLWGKSGYDFMCIEPWNGIADFENGSGQLEVKKGILQLSSNETWKGSWQFKVT